MFKNLIMGITLSFTMFTQAEDLKFGKDLFNKSCIGCHGPDVKTAQIPIIFGQEPGYIINSLQAFSQDLRKDNSMFVMNELAKSLTVEQIQSLAAYVAGIDPCVVKMKFDTKDPKFKERFTAGRDLATKKRCAHCHDSYHHAAPRLYGQKMGYMVRTLRDFKSGKRKNRFMNHFAKDLQEKEIKNLSFYLNGMRLMRECK